MSSRITKIEIYLPEKTLTNNHLSKEFGRWDADTMENKVGIRERRIAAENETAGDMAFYAAEKVLENYDREKIDMLILCTQSPDYFLPTTACLLQKKLGLSNDVGAFDFNQGCSGYIYGLSMAKAFINSDVAKNVLLIMSETYSKHIHNRDLANKSIFGDGAAATIIEKSDNEHIFDFILGTDGSGRDNLIVSGGCFRQAFNPNYEEKITNSGDIYTDNHLFMNGPEIFNFTINAVPKAVKQCLEKNKLTMDNIDYFIFHQANKFMIDYLRKKIRIPQEKFYSNLLLTGNTVSATIPIALKDCIDNKIVTKGNKVLLCGFGVGYSWGSVVIEI